MGYLSGEDTGGRSGSPICGIAMGDGAGNGTGGFIMVEGVLGMGLDQFTHGGTAC